jgi:hypothetical protein
MWLKESPFFDTLFPTWVGSAVRVLTNVVFADQLFLSSRVEASIVARASRVSRRSSHQHHVARRSVEASIVAHRQFVKTAWLANYLPSWEI